MKEIKLMVVALASCAMFCGCTPEETFVVVKASELKKAASGQLGTAKVEMVFDIQDKKDLELPNKIRRAALPYLGEGAVVEVEKTEVKKRKTRSSGSLRDDESEEEVDESKSLEGAKLVARFNIPVGTERQLNSAERSIMWLKYRESDNMFLLVNGNNVRALNSALSRVESSVDYEYDGGSGSSVTVKVVNDETISLGVAAVEVNGKKVIAGSVNTGKGALKLNFDNSFYSGLAPCFRFGGYPDMTSEKCEKVKSGSAWDD